MNFSLTLLVGTDLFDSIDWMSAAAGCAGNVAGIMAFRISTSHWCLDAWRDELLFIIHCASHCPSCRLADFICSIFNTHAYQHLCIRKHPLLKDRLAPAIHDFGCVLGNEHDVRHMSRCFILSVYYVLYIFHWFALSTLMFFRGFFCQLWLMVLDGVC